MISPDVAQTAIDRGWSVIPLGNDKRPRGPWKERQEKALTLEQLAPELPKAAALGVVTGHLSGLIVLDTDDKKADEFMRSLGLEPHVKTPSGGHHYYFRHPGDGRFKTFNPQNEGDDAQSYRERYGLLDCRADGGYVAFAGTVAKGSYEQLRSPDELYELDQLPAELVDILRYGYKGQSAALPTRRAPSAAGQGASIERLLKEAQTRTGGGRDNACFWLAPQLRDNGHSKEAALQAMEQFWQTLPSANTKGQVEEFPLQTALDKVEIAYSQPARDPWGGPKFATTDLGNGKRLAQAGADSLRHISGQGWLTWDGKRWRASSEGLAMKIAKDVAEGMAQEAYDMTQAAKQIADEQQQNAALTQAKEMTRHAHSSQNINRINAMLKLAETEPQVAATSEDFDTAPYLLNVQNGTLDLQTGELRPHRREDMLTRLVGIKYDPNAKCPNWLKFLHTITGGDQDLILYLKRAAGYVLTGSSDEHVIFILHGEGQNGKSTFVNVLERLTGEYAAAVDSKTLLNKRYGGSGINNDLARLKGIRLAHASEPDMGSLLDEALLKKLSSGERVTARFLHKEFFEFTPEFKLMLSANHMPDMRGNDKGIWRRLKLIPFNVTIPDSEKQRDFFEKQLEPELEGILAWAVEGALEWNQDGLAEPKAVIEGTKNYREEMDLIGQFIDERCEVNPQGREEAGQLYAAYKEWTLNNGGYPLSKQKLGRELKSRGYEDQKSNNLRYRVGLRLRSLVPHSEAEGRVAGME